MAVTERLNDLLTEVDVPAVVACSVTGYVPAGVPLGTSTLAVIFTGLPCLGLTLFPGVKLQVADGIVVLQETETLWLNDPPAVTWKLTVDEVVPRATVTLEGDGALMSKLSRWRATASEFVT